MNTGNETLDLSGYELRDNSDDHRWRFPNNSTLKSGEFLIVEANSKGLVYDDQTQTFPLKVPLVLAQETQFAFTIKAAHYWMNTNGQNMHPMKVMPPNPPTDVTPMEPENFRIFQLQQKERKTKSLILS